MRSWLARTLVILGCVALATLAVARPAAAGGPTRVTLTGPNLTEPLVVRYETQEELFQRLYQFSTLIGAGNGLSAAATPVDPGPSWTMTVDYHDIPTYRYLLHPFATGGPVIYVPAKQPRGDSQLKEGWYNGGIGMLDHMRAANVLPAVAPVAREVVASVPAASETRSSSAVLPWIVAIMVPVIVGVLLLTRSRLRRQP